MQPDSPSKNNTARTARWRGLFIAAFAATRFWLVMPQKASAQFVCDSDAAGESGAGASAATSAANVACGTNANASGFGSGNTAAGNAANASGGGSGNTAAGNSANASGGSSNNTAAGFSADASGDNSNNTATGRSAAAAGDNSFNTATGRSAAAGGDNSFNTATGNAAAAFGDNSLNTAMGFVANASGANTSNVAIGANSVATGGLSTAVGPSASAAFANAAAFGTGATATRAGQQVFGTAANTYTTPGLPSAASLAAQGPVTGVVTTDASGNLASDGGALRNDVNDNREGVAMAMAMGGSYLPPQGKAFAITGNWGTFEGDNAIAFNGTARLSNNVYLNGGFGAGLNQGTAGGRAGVTFTW